ncbi:hypothetical protein Dsin_013527 [Dipteronia sinensis]|uniref:Uncharacterized protein n=1 Tax=Dipteronia sinensis TaxID=43782 RepID=A0AAE0AK71_9ROSI|nr:hypothetical protein Dsin_013527 [Dipteronia sinensis]
MKFMDEFHKDSAIVREINSTFIALIPKCGNPALILDFSPINLVGSMYKVLAKPDKKSYALDHWFGIWWKMEKVDEGLYLLSGLIGVVVEGLSSLLRKAHGLGMISGISFGHNEVHVSHVQFADDTILFLKPRMDYLLNAKRILRCFELASGLKINFHKSCIVRIGDRVVNGEVWAASFQCMGGSLPINYLGLPLRARPCALAFWKNLIRRLEACLAPWKRKFLTKSGRLVLIKSILSSIPNYFLSIFKISSGVANNIEKLQRSFFWGDGVENRKAYTRGLYPMEKSRLCQVRECEWEAKVGFEVQFFLFFLYRAVDSLFETGSKSATILNEGIQVIVGNGERAVFWKDLLWNSIPLKVAFPRSFALDINKEGAVRDHGRWEGSKWVWKVDLRRPIFD